MLYAFGFDRIGSWPASCSSPCPLPGRAPPTRSRRLKVRLFERGELRGSVFSAQPIAIDRPIWRADLLESVANPRSLDRAHHHPRFRGWEPTRTQRRAAQLALIEPAGHRQVSRA